MAADKAGTTDSYLKANVMLFHAKVMASLSNSIDALYVQSTLKVFAELTLRSNHDALVLWYIGNYLLRHGKSNVELLPADPAETNYCANFPGCAPDSAVAADNAQTILQLIDRAHNFSDQMRRMTGCCVCRLIQDFNVQTMNIVSSLLSPYGLVSATMDSVAELGLPVGPQTNFWTFFMNQMKKSSPARTAFLAAFAKSTAARFRNNTPVNSITLDHVESTGHVFAVMMHEAMRRNPHLAQGISHVLAKWMQQPKHSQGKSLCLIYLVTEVAFVLRDRRHHAEVTSETEEDLRLFSEAIAGAASALSAQLPRLLHMVSTTGQSNETFTRMVRKVHRRIRGLLADLGDRPIEAMPFDDDLGKVDDRDVVAADQVSLAALENPSDNDIFDNSGYGELDGDQEDADNGLECTDKPAEYCNGEEPTGPPHRAMHDGFTSASMKNHVHAGVGNSPQSVEKKCWSRSQSTQTRSLADAQQQTVNVDANSICTSAHHHRPRRKTADIHEGVVPSTVVLEYLMLNQGTESALHDLRQINLEASAWLDHDSAVNRYHAPHQPFVPPVEEAVMTVTVEGQPNNYFVPHGTGPTAPPQTFSTRMKVQRMDTAHSDVPPSKHGRVERREAVPPKIFLDQSAASALQDIQGERLDGLTPSRGAENMNVNTPFGQRMIPTCLVEQNNDTAMREIRQVLGTRLSNSHSNRKRSAVTGHVDDGSAVWWSERSTAPMPSYAADTRFSMEMF
jgi:hypothetical protein